MKEWRVATGDIIHLRYKLSHLLGISHHQICFENMLRLEDPTPIRTMNKFGTHHGKTVMKRVNTIFSRTSEFFPRYFVHVSQESSEHSQRVFFSSFPPEDSEAQGIVLTELQCVRLWWLEVKNQILSMPCHGKKYS